ncbi:unnamed protein product [Ectocarpus sp. 4 AP-2014]
MGTCTHGAGSNKKLLFRGPVFHLFWPPPPFVPLSLCPMFCFAFFGPDQLHPFLLHHLSRRLPPSSAAPWTHAYTSHTPAPSFCSRTRHLRWVIGKTMATPTTAGRVIIGQGITVKGDIKNCDEVIVRGFFDAGNVEAKTVVVEADGVLTGATKAQNAKIAGKFDGHLRLTEGLNVTSSGEAKGTIRYRGIQVENGGKLFGDIQFATEEEDS